MSHESDVEVIDLDELTEPVARVKLKGVLHDVMPITGNAYDIVVQVQKAGTNMSIEKQLEYTRKILADIVPTITEEQRKTLSLKQMLKLVELSSSLVGKVDRAIGRSNARKNGQRSAPGARNHAR